MVDILMHILVLIEIKFLSALALIVEGVGLVQVTATHLVYFTLEHICIARIVQDQMVLRRIVSMLGIERMARA